MKEIVVWIDGEPKGQPRLRAFARRVGVRVVARVFDPGTAEAWKSAIATAVREYVPEKPHDEPVRMILALYFPRPKGHRDGAGKLRKDAPQCPLGRPDVDNCAKAATDALTMVGFWREDSLVVDLCVTKEYASGRPGAWLRLRVGPMPYPEATQ